MAKKAKPKKRVVKTASRRRRIGLSIALVVCTGLVVYLGYLNYLINQRFDGDTWALPSRVYSRSLELFPGLTLGKEALEYEINLSGYQKVIDEPLPGQYRLLGQSLEFHNRAFAFVDGQEPSRQIQIFFDGNTVDAIVDSISGDSLPLYRMPPLVIGSYFPSSGEDRIVLDKTEVPKLLTDILVAVEDQSFYDHFGISPMSIFRALIANIDAGKTVQGGSTLTQQLAKNLFLSSEKSILRKINEAFMALILEMRFSKQAILTAYINEVFLLQQNRIAIHGFGLASRKLFKRSLDQLRLDELALLVAMVKGPSNYNPVKHPENARTRRNLVLKVIRRQGVITEADYQQAISRPIKVVTRLPGISPYPAYLDLVKRQMLTSYSADELAAQGLRIFTAFDPQAQRNLESGLKKGLSRFAQPELQAGVVMADYLNGDIRALVGDRDTDYPGFNRAIMAQRPIGSLIKPLLLYSLLENGLSLASQVIDQPVTIQQSDNQLWQPRNYDRKLHGKMTLYQAFIKSYNLPFVNLGVNGGLQPLVENLQKINLLKHDVIYPSLLLGTSPMSAFEVAQMFQVIANNGYFAPLTTIRTVTDQHFRALSRIPLASHKLFDQATMLQVQRALIGVSENGTADYLARRFKSQTFAGKTGTTNEARDSWFAGFSERLLTVVWLGRDDNKPIHLTGSSGALRVWADIMQTQQLKPFKLSRDDSIVWKHIDPTTGGMTKNNCVNSVLLPFPKTRLPVPQSLCP